MAEVIRQDELDVFSFLGLLAGEGQVPGARSAKEYTPLAVATEEAVREIVSDFAAEGDFFTFMVENGQMRAEAPAKKYNIKIVRPTNLGGGLGGGFGGAVAAH